MTTPTYRATLLEDGGRSVLSDQFFRSAAYFRAERVSHTLVVAGRAGSLRVPLVVRPIPGTALADATSPYGHPGGQLDAPGPIAPAEVDWSGVPLVSIFVRDRVGEATCFSGGTLRAQTLIVDLAAPVKLRADHESNIRRNLRAGYQARVVRGPEAPPEARAIFLQAYSETMVRRGAAARYFLSRSWLDSVLEGPRTYLIIVYAPDGAPAAANLVVCSDGFLHSHGGGTLDGHLKASPAKNATWEKIALARTLGLSLHLGAGLRPNDGLEQFKRGFANASRPFFSHDIVCDPAAYRALSAGILPGPFFPRYRASRTGAGLPALTSEPHAAMPEHVGKDAP